MQLMDFDIGNIFYVVITLVAIIASLLGKKKKPAGKQAKPGFFENLEQVLNMGQENPVLMDLQENDSDLPEVVEELEYENFNEDSKSIENVPSLMEEYESLLLDRGGTLMTGLQMEGERSTEPIDLIELDEQEEPDYFKIMSDFNVGTAIVYSAIINRVNY